MKILKLKIENYKAGFTIIETMIAVSLFLVVVTIGMGALLNANLLHQKSRDMRSIVDNLSFVMEDMSKNLRTGSKYYCITGADNLLNITIPKSGASCWGIAFQPSFSGNQWVYYIDNVGKIWKSTQGPYNILSNYVQLTPDEVIIDTATSGFSVLGAEPPPGNSEQPFVTIRLVGKINYKNISTPFSLQTSVSQRQIDI